MSRLFYFTLLVCSLATFAWGEKVRYDNYHAYALEPKTRTQISALQALASARDEFLFLDGVHHVNIKIPVFVAPQRVAEFEHLLRKANITFLLESSNVQSVLDEPIEPVADPNRRDAEYTWTEYHELDDTYSWLHNLAAIYPKQVSIFVAGRSYEGREILGVKIAYGGEKKAIFLEGGMHAREWIGPATTTYILNQLLTSTDKDVRLIAESFDWYIVPHANPDGYAYTHSGNRLWRKTRTPYGNCFGADPNRNWDFHWREEGTSDDPCTDTYGGPSPFSEIETRTLAEFIRTLQDKVFLYVSFHSYSQLLLFPYGHTNELPPNYNELKRIFDVTIKAVKERYGTKYTGGNIYDAIYPASGASLDWAYGTLGIPYSFCFELRPSSTSILTGFRLPAAQIIPTGEETLDALVAMVKQAGILRN